MCRVFTQRRCVGRTQDAIFNSLALTFLIELDNKLWEVAKSVFHLSLGAPALPAETWVVLSSEDLAEEHSVAGVLQIQPLHLEEGFL